jgi:hypothetical protein
VTARKRETNTNLITKVFTTEPLLETSNNHQKESEAKNALS